MTPERWAVIKEAFDAAIALQGDGRRLSLDRIGAADPELLREVESLLRAHEAAGSAFLTPPAAEPDTPLNRAGAGPGRVGGQIGPYRVTGELGRGGMGEVYRAVRADGNFTKEVALKVVRGGIDAAFIVDRFRNERQILASLDHPNIARLLDGGTTADGLPYLVMELVDGAPIDIYCDAHRLTIRDRLRLFREVCAAVQYAHQRLVVHRDIKPTNVLVTSAGVPKLLDFGIAKILDASKDGPITLARPMTLEYASPEQILGKLDDASAVLQRARALVEPPPSAERHDVPALYATAETVADIGELAQRQARASGSPGDRTRLKEQAQQAYRKGLEIWRGIPSPASITPIGVTASALGDLSARLAQEDRR